MERGGLDKTNKKKRYLHINGCQRTVGNTTADGTGESEAGIQLDTRQLLRFLAGNNGFDCL